MSELVILLFEVTAVFAIALLGARLASSASAATRHLILASAFGIVLILPLAARLSPTITVEIPALPARESVPVAISPMIPPDESPAVLPEASPAAIGNLLQRAPSQPAGAAKSRPVATGLLLLWAVMAVIALVPVGRSLWLLRIIRRRSHAWPDTRRLHQLMPATGIRRPLVLLSDGIAAPIAAGLLRPVITLPADAMTWHDTHLANALLHEMEHVRRHDWMVHLVSRTACALYWFHPLAWIAWRSLRLEAEQACDDAVLARADAATYAQQLLELARNLKGRSLLPGLQMVGGSDLATRIKAVLDAARPRGRVGKIALAGIVFAAIVAVAMLAPLRATGPTRSGMDLVSTGATAPADVPADATMPARAEQAASAAFDFGYQVGLVDLARPDCLSMLNSSISPGTRITLVKPRSDDPALLLEATIGEPQAQECRSVLASNTGDSKGATSYRLQLSVDGVPPGGVLFALLGPVGPVSLRNGQIEADLDNDGASESFDTCNSIESLHFLIWSEFPEGRRARWHGSVYVGYDMGPTCTDEQIAGMVALDEAASSGGNSPPATPGNASAVPAPPIAASQVSESTSPRVLVTGILDLVQSALANDATRTLDEIMYPITGLQHVQRYARAVLDDDGHDPARLAGNYLEIINALLNTADLAEGSAARPPAPGIDAQQYRQLAARMRSMSGDLAALVMPITSSTKSSDATPELRAARAVLDITRMTRGESSAPGSPWRAWMLTELNTLDHAAQSVLSDGPGEPGATSLRLNLFRASIKATALQAERISARADSPSEARRKTSSLAASLRDIAGRFEPARTLPAAAPGVVPAGKDWLVTMRSVGPLAVGTSINDARAIIGDPAAYLVQALRQDHALPREPDSAACAYLATTAVPAGLGLMFQSGRLARVDIWQPGVRTTDGAQVGDSEARIRGIYGSALRITQHHYPPVGAHDMTLEPADVADRDYLLRFETDGDKVTQFRIGIREAVEATEGCE